MKAYIRDKAETMRSPRNGGKQKEFIAGNKVSDEFNEEFLNTIQEHSDLSFTEVADFLNRLSPKERIVLRGKLNNMPGKDIGLLVGCSQSYVGRILRNKIAPKALNYFNWEVG